MGSFLPFIPTGLAVVIGILIVTLVTLTVGNSTMTNIANSQPQPLTGAVWFTVGLFGAALGLGIKLLDAPRRKARLGSGARFRGLEKQLAARSGVKNPAGLAASIGTKKYGRVRFQKLSISGRRRRLR